jgi:hypothetical protein
VKNYILEFIETNNRIPSQEEVGQLMAVVAKSEVGKPKSKGYMERFKLAKEKGAKGGRKKIPLELSQNAIKINNLLHVGYAPTEISNILKLKSASVKSIIYKQSLPRPNEMILNLQLMK